MASEQKPGQPAATPGQNDEAHLGMMGDGTIEQDLNQPGHPEARITQEEVEEAFSQDKGDKGAA